MALLHLYMNNPTSGAVDGTEISNGNETLPLTFTVDAGLSETKVAKCAVRCDSGYQIEGDTTISFEGTTSAMWNAAVDNNYSNSATALSSATWQSEITLSSVTSVNKIFWVKVTSEVSENPSNDATVDIKAKGLVTVAE